MAEDEGNFEESFKMFISSWSSGLPGNRYIERRQNFIPPEALSAYIEYLDAPHSHGYWRLTAKWLRDGQVQQYLIKSLVQQDDNKIPEGRSLIPYIAVNKPRSESIDTLMLRISPLLTLFDYSYRKVKDPEDKIDIPRRLKAPDEMPPISSEYVRDTFQESFCIFADQVWFDDYEPSIAVDKPHFLKTGAIFLHVRPRERRGRIEISSLDKTSLESFASFLQACGAIAQPNIERIFAPEEVLLAPYFAYLRSTFEQIIDDSRILPQLRQAFDYYKADDFQHCISTLGIIAEDYFTQVYSTFFREPCQIGWTLGQIYDQVHSRLRELSETPKQEPISLDDLYDLAKKTQAVDKNVESDELADLIRRIANLIKRDRTVFQERIEQLKNKPRSRSVFPKYLQDNIEELIRNRNAASHKTRIPLGNYEAQKTLYSLVSLIFWWNRLKKKLPWTESKMDIIHFAITLAAEEKRK